MKISVFPGSFDPITNGHLGIIKRAAKLFDEVHVLICENSAKTSFFDSSERELLVCDAVKELSNVRVLVYSGLLAKYAAEHNAVLVKGLRSATDYSYEYELFEINREVSREFTVNTVDTVFLPCEKESIFISSTMVREMIKHGSSFDGFVPNPTLLRKLLQKQK